MLVERSVYDRALQAAERAATATKVAPASEQGDHIGPLVSEIQWDKSRASSRPVRTKAPAWWRAVPAAPRG
jgi:acyl-CoA reductase-like NAD-dependent aldehyde dehydrogenase